MLETVQGEPPARPPAHALFVASNPALTVFVAKWLANRIKGGLGAQRKLLDRLHVMSAESARPRKVTIGTGNASNAIEVLALPSDTPARQYALVVLDEAHHACRDPVLLAAVLGRDWPLPHVRLNVTHFSVG